LNVKFVDDLDGSVFVDAARKSSGSATTGSRRAQKMAASSGRRPQPLDREQTTAIRAWARQNGHQVTGLTAEAGP